MVKPKNVCTFAPAFGQRVGAKLQKGSGFSAVGSAHVWGARGRWFESSNPDQTKREMSLNKGVSLFLFLVFNPFFNPFERNCQHYVFTNIDVILAAFSHKEGYGLLSYLTIANFYFCKNLLFFTSRLNACQPLSNTPSI